MSSVTAPERLRVLVVDDEMSVRAFAEIALLAAGYEVVVVSDGPEALRLVDALPRSWFDLFVLDIVMPQMRGDELGRRLRDQNPDVKVLYFTAFSDHLFNTREPLCEHEAFIEKGGTVAGLLDPEALHGPSTIA